jgi:hypothetical protein
MNLYVYTEKGLGSYSWNHVLVVAYSQEEADQFLTAGGDDPLRFECEERNLVPGVIWGDCY